MLSSDELQLELVKRYLQSWTNTEDASYTHVIGWSPSTSKVPGWSTGMIVSGEGLDPKRHDLVENA